MKTELKSIRYGQVHFHLADAFATGFPSKNKAKAHSRELGGAGAVVVTASRNEAETLHQNIRKAKEEKEKKEKNEVEGNG